MSFKTKTLIVVLEVIFVVIILIYWLNTPSMQESKNLWVLFFYSIPAGFLVGIVPHEPVLLYFAKFYPPWIIAIVAIGGTLLTETLNYTVLGYFVDFSFANKIRESKTSVKLVELFKKAPFIALWIGAFTPLPFYPLRFLVVLAKYPLKKYLFALSLSRTPRFYLLAYLGYVVKIPDNILFLIFLSLFAAAGAPYLKVLHSKYKNRKSGS